MEQCAAPLPLAFGQKPGAVLFRHNMALAHADLHLSKRQRISHALAAGAVQEMPNADCSLLLALPDDLLLCIVTKGLADAPSIVPVLHLWASCRRLRSVVQHPSILRSLRREAVAVSLGFWSLATSTLLSMACAANNPHACYHLGMIKFYCERNVAAGLSLLMEAAVANHPDALYALGVIEFNGSATTKRDRNPRGGLILVGRAAALGHTDATMELAHCVMDGLGTAPNRAEGKRLLAKARAMEAEASAAVAASALAAAASPAARAATSLTGRHNARAAAPASPAILSRIEREDATPAAACSFHVAAARGPARSRDPAPTEEQAAAAALPASAHADASREWPTPSASSEHVGSAPRVVFRSEAWPTFPNPALASTCPSSEASSSQGLAQPGAERPGQTQSDQCTAACDSREGGSPLQALPCMRSASRSLAPWGCTVASSANDPCLCGSTAHGGSSDPGTLQLPAGGADHRQGGPVAGAAAGGGGAQHLDRDVLTYAEPGGGALDHRSAEAGHAARGSEAISSIPATPVTPAHQFLVDWWTVELDEELQRAMQQCCEAGCGWPAPPLLPGTPFVGALLSDLHEHSAPLKANESWRPGGSCTAMSSHVGHVALDYWRSPLELFSEAPAGRPVRLACDLSERALCSNELCGRREMRPREFRCCASCREAKYCSRACQSRDWKRGHKVACSMFTSLLQQHILAQQRLLQTQGQQQQHEQQET